jgi:PBP1b-binding outer membrane lipoprotein LpoB
MENQIGQAFKKTVTCIFITGLALAGLLLLSGCVMRYASIENRSAEMEDTSTVRVSVSLDAGNGYISPGLQRNLEASPILDLYSGSAIAIRIDAKQSFGYEAENASTTLFNLTLGLLPKYETWPAEYRFQVVEKESVQVLRTYRYEPRKYVVGHITLLAFMPLELFGIGAHEFSHPFQEAHSWDVTEGAVTAAFEKDLLRDLQDQSFRAKFETGRGTDVYVLLPLQGNASESIRNHVRESLETALVDAGVRLVERQRLNQILDEQLMGQTGLTDSDSVRIGRLLAARFGLVASVTHADGQATSNTRGPLTIRLHCVDLESGAILWKRERLVRNRMAEPSNIHFAARFLITSLHKEGML